MIIVVGRLSIQALIKLIIFAKNMSPMAEKQIYRINPLYASDKSIEKFVVGLHDSFNNNGRIVYNKRNTLKIMSTGSEAMPVVAVKKFKPLGLLRGLYYTYIGINKAERCFNHAIELETRAIATPEPLAYVQVSQCGVIRECYYICRCVELPAVKDGIHWEDRYDAAMAESFSSMAAAMHKAGVVHGDLNCDNVLYSKNADGSFSFTLIDINRMKFYPRGTTVPDSEAMADMCCFTRSLKVMRSVAEYYAKARGWDNEMVERMVDSKRRFNRRREIKKRILHPTRKY